MACLVVLVLILVGTKTPGTNREWSRSGDQIVSDAPASLLAASSVQLTGTMNNGRETDVYEVTVGAHSSIGTVVANGARLDVRVIGSTVYMHGREFFTTFGGSAAGAAVGDHWVKASLDDPRNKSLGAVRLQTLAELFTTSGRGTILKKNTTNGTAVGTLEAGNGTVTVALDGTPYPQHFSGTVDAEGVTASIDFTLSRYNAAMPPVDAPVDVLDMGGSFSV